MLALLVACDGGSAAPEATTTPTAAAMPSATPSPLPATATPQPPAAVAPTEPPPAASQPLCPDPYPDGAPSPPEPGEPIRIAPSPQPPALPAFQPLAFTRDMALQGVVRDALGEDRERFSVVVKDLADGRGAAVARNRVYYAASLFKTWVMVEAYHQREAGLLDFGERYVVSDYYQQHSVNPGEIAPCSEVSVGEAVLSMIRISDNTAANLLLDRVGAHHVNTALESLGLDVTGFAGGGSLPTTAREMARLLEAIARKQAVSPSASDEMLELLASEVYRDRLAALLPEGTRVAHKTGNWSDATHDAGVVFSPAATYVIVALSDFGFSEDGASVIARVSRAVYDYYNGG